MIAGWMYWGFQAGTVLGRDAEAKLSGMTLFACHGLETPMRPILPDGQLGLLDTSDIANPQSFHHTLG